MEPVEVMLGAGRKAIHQGMEVVAAVGQEDEVLVHLQALPAQDLEDPALRPVVGTQPK